ncbi:MAG TPA: GtrA family protein [Vicinamibacterales bacterium]|nr:GtrA family protein [Vicinamibacterales bacterium]
MTRFIRFAIAGTAGFGVQLAVLTILVAAQVHYVAATVVAVEAAILLNFICHERFTWKDRGRESGFARLLRFNALSAATSIAGSVVITAILVEYVGLSPMLANVISVIVLSVINFVGADSLVFRAAATLALVMVIASASSAQASDTIEATLQAKTKADFAKYVATVEARRARDITNKAPFLDIERQNPADLARTMAALKRGEVIVSRGSEVGGTTSEIPIDGGQVNHWRGTVFVPNVTLDNMLKVLQEPQTDKHKQEDVLSSRVMSRDGDSQKVYLRLRRTKFVTVVYDTEYNVDYKRLSPDRAISNSISTKVVEVENAGTPKERQLPEGNDHGYMWNLNSYWRYKQFEGGVLVEIESLTLSRDLPAIIGPLIRPIVNSTARESMTRTLASVRARFSS